MDSVLCWLGDADPCDVGCGIPGGEPGYGTDGKASVTKVTTGQDAASVSLNTYERSDMNCEVGPTRSILSLHRGDSSADAVIDFAKKTSMIEVAPDIEQNASGLVPTGRMIDASDKHKGGPVPTGQTVDASHRHNVVNKDEMKPKLMVEDEAPAPRTQSQTHQNVGMCKHMREKLETFEDDQGPTPSHHTTVFDEDAALKRSCAAAAHQERRPRFLQNLVSRLASPSTSVLQANQRQVIPNDDDTETPNLPTLEATLVQGVKATLIVPSEPKVPDVPPLYEATRVPSLAGSSLSGDTPVAEADDQPLKWSKKYSGYIYVVLFITIGAMAVAIGMLAGDSSNTNEVASMSKINAGAAASAPSSGPSPSTPTQVDIDNDESGSSAESATSVPPSGQSLAPSQINMPPSATAQGPSKSPSNMPTTSGSSTTDSDSRRISNDAIDLI